MSDLTDDVAAYTAGYRDAMERSARDAPKIYQLGYDAGVRDTEVEPEVLAAVDRLIRRYAPRADHHHRLARPLGRPRYAR